MQLLLLGLNHKTTPIEIREKCAFSEDEAQKFLFKVKNDGLLPESVILSTCNRTENYSLVPETEQGEKYLRQTLQEIKKTDLFQNGDSLYVLKETDSVRHLFRVACGLDSMVLGENEILGQIKQAFQRASETGTTGVVLNKLFHQAFRIGKKARSESPISVGSISFGKAAVELTKKIFEDISHCKILLIGAGEAASLVVDSLKENQVGSFRIANRNYEKALELAGQLGGHAIGLEEIPKILKEVDITISSIATEDFLLTYEELKNLMQDRHPQPLCIIDISVPRSIDPHINKIDNVFLYNIDDLQKIIEQNLSFRAEAIPQVERMIKDSVYSFAKWRQELQVVPLLQKLQEYFEKLATQEVEKNFKYSSATDKEKLLQFTQGVANKLLANPVKVLKELNQESEFGLLKLEAIRELFQIGEKSEKD